jgi:hypothetical protein
MRQNQQSSRLLKLLVKRFVIPDRKEGDLPLPGMMINDPVLVYLLPVKAAQAAVKPWLIPDWNIRRPSTSRYDD